MSTHKMESSSSKGKRRTLTKSEIMFIEEWLSDLSHGAGPSVMKRKFDQFLLRMGY